MKRNLITAIVLLVCILPFWSDCSDAEDATEEYWCYGDSLTFVYEGDSAQVGWTVSDSTGTVRSTEEGYQLEFDASHFDTLYVTQKVTTGEGSSVQTVKVNLMHHTGGAFIVSFYSDRDSAPVDVQSFDAYTVCKNGVFAQVPDTPAAPADNMQFGGWFVGSGDSEREFSENDPVTSSMDVYAKWLGTYNVTFISQGQFFDAYTAVEGREFELPEVPLVEGKVFGGWFYDQKFTQPFDQEEGISDDQVLYAKWTDVKSGSEPVFNLLLLIPLAAVIGVLAWMHMHRRKTKVKSTHRYR